jgi:hypothetical protein
MFRGNNGPWELKDGNLDVAGVCSTGKKGYVERILIASFIRRRFGWQYRIWTSIYINISVAVSVFIASFDPLCLWSLVPLPVPSPRPPPVPPPDQVSFILSERIGMMAIRSEKFKSQLVSIPRYYYKFQAVCSEGARASICKVPL